MRVALLAVLALLTVACGAPGPTATPTGQLRFSVHYTPPPGDAPLSIGGYVAVGKLVGQDGAMVYDGELRPPANERSGTDLMLAEAGGIYSLEVSVVQASDAIGIDQYGNMQRELGPVSATCSGSVTVTPPMATTVAIEMVGGMSCSVSRAEPTSSRAQRGSASLRTAS